MSREPSPLLGYGPIQSNAWLRATENIPPRPKRARRWLKSQIDCHSEVRSSNTGGHETDYDAVANLHLPESLRSSYIRPKHRKRSIQQHSESPNLPCTNPPISFVPRPGAFAQKLNPEEFLSLVDDIKFMDRDTAVGEDIAHYKLRNEQKSVSMGPRDARFKGRGRVHKKREFPRTPRIRSLSDCPPWKQPPTSKNTVRKKQRGLQMFNRLNLLLVLGEIDVYVVLAFAANSPVLPSYDDDDVQFQF